ncbi:hypothetical protein GOODEAATRI_015836, partial [Goodea atripinnis]
ESPEGDQSAEPTPEVSASGVSAPSAYIDGQSAQSGTGSSSFVSLPSTVTTNPQNPSDTYKSTYTSTHLSVGDRARTPSPMESLMGSPRRYGDGTTRTTTTLSSRDLLRGPKPYQQ